MVRQVPAGERPPGAALSRSGLDRAGETAAGHYTKKLAEEALREILTDAQRGTLAGLDKSGVTFADAAAEFVRYASDVRQVDDVTVRDYRGVIDGYLLDAFGSEPLESITPDMIDSYKEDLIAERRLSNRTIVRHLTVLHGIFKRAKRVWSCRTTRPQPSWSSGRR